MFAIFHFWGNDSVSRQFLKTDAMVSILRRRKVLSCVLKFHRDHELFWLFWSKDLIILIISSTQNSKNESVSLVSKFIFTGSLLSLDIGVHCLAKKSWNRFALSKKSVTSFLSASSGGMCGVLLSFTMFSRWPSMFLGLFLGHLVY